MQYVARDNIKENKTLRLDKSTMIGWVNGVGKICAIRCDKTWRERSEITGK